jgi:hypothetical protein
LIHSLTCHLNHQPSPHAPGNVRASQAWDIHTLTPRTFFWKIVNNNEHTHIQWTKLDVMELSNYYNKYLPA